MLVTCVINVYYYFQIEALNNTTDNDMNVEVTKFSEDEVVIEISQDKMNKKEHNAGGDDDDDDESEANDTESVVGVTTSQRCTNTSTDIYHDAEPVSQLHDGHKVLQKYRSMSESSGDESVSIRDGQSCLLCKSLGVGTGSSFPWG
jgi:hypothetical protein